MRLLNVSGKLAFLSMVLIILSPCWFALQAVNFPYVWAQEGPLNPDAQVFTLANHNGAAPIGVGETFHIVLEANPSTGYSWQVAGVDTAILQAGEVQFRRTSELLGAPEEQIIPFTALRSGATTVDMRYARPWEEETRLQNYIINVRVTE
ncbi:MAG: protease inhibitor I42 family protein [Thermodesulfobacteriota bacterium]|nr:protease inhibitor I42 family protein [Thermodesulfobacteriota bacterium]